MRKIKDSSGLKKRSRKKKLWKIFKLKRFWWKQTQKNKKRKCLSVLGRIWICVFVQVFKMWEKKNHIFKHKITLNHQWIKVVNWSALQRSIQLLFFSLSHLFPLAKNIIVCYCSFSGIILLVYTLLMMRNVPETASVTWEPDNLVDYKFDRFSMFSWNLQTIQELFLN